MAHKDSTKSYWVYIHTTPSGKKYVGLTSKLPEKRWANGKGYKSSRYFYNAIQKYGWENITHEVLYEGLSWEEASQEERRLIKLYHSNDTRYGYNRTTGGEDGFHHDPETINKIGNASKELWKTQNHRNYMHKVNEERWRDNKDEKERLAQMMKKRWANPQFREKILSAAKEYNDNPIHKKEVSERAKALWKNDEYRNKMAERFNGANNPSARVVYQYSLSGDFINVYDTCKEAAKNIGLKTSTGICACARGEQKSSGGYLWSYEKKEKINVYETNNCKKVCKLNKNGEVLEVYNSISIAEKEIGHHNIYEAIKRHWKSGGYYWCYYGDNDYFIPQKNRCYREILQLDLNMNIICKYISIREASRSTYIADGNISQCLKGRSKTAGGYIWRYADVK